MESLSDNACDHEVIEGMVVLGNHVFLLGLGAVNVKDAAFFESERSDEFVLTLLDHLVALVELGLGHRPLLDRRQHGLLSWKHLEVLAEFLVRCEEGVEITAHDDIILLQLLF